MARALLRTSFILQSLRFYIACLLISFATSSNGTYSIVNAYDNANRLTSTTQGTLALTHQYDAAGNRTRTTWPGASYFVTRTFDALNRLSTLTENGTQLLATYNYDNLSRRASITRSNGTSTTYAFDTQSALSGLTQDMTGTSADVNYTYARNQLGEITNNSWSNSLYQWTGAHSGTVAYTSNGLNQYTSVASNTVTSDSNGNMTSDGLWNYTYNNDNQLTSASSGSTTANLSYDAYGRLRQTAYVAGATTNLLYDGDALVGEYDTAGTAQRRYIHGANTDEPLVWYEGNTTANKYWLYADNLGSIIATADSTGTAATAFTYGPYGEPGNLAGVRFRYTGKQLLNLGTQGIYYSKARMYSPALGRFLQTDPTGYQDNMHLYAYVGNNPINRVDPKGTNEEEAAALEASSLGSANTIRVNAANGAAFENVGLGYLNNFQTDIESQVSVRPYLNSNGDLADYRVRLDAIGNDNGNVALTDFKSSETAGFTPNQTNGYPLISDFGGVVVGNGGGSSYPAGYIIPPTSVDIYRPSDIISGPPSPF